jgi:acyl carrier protein
MINRLLDQKGLPAVQLRESDRFLGEGVQMDSLDLAVLVTELEQLTKKDPFKDGFRNFRTVGELAHLYAD